MIVKLNNEVIAGSGVTPGPGNLRINSRILVQEADFLRAIEGAQYDRGNHRNVVTFNVHYLFSDEADAEVWLLERGDTLLGRGRVTFICKSATREIERYLNNAVVRSTVGQQIGVTIILDYEITGGQFLKGNS